MHRLTVSFSLALVAQIVLAQAPLPPRVEVVVETANGVEVRDPYRWMEQGGPQFDQWSRAEAAHARSTLDGIRGREALYERIGELDQPGTGLTDLQVRGGRWLYERLAAGGKRRLFVRRGQEGDERELDLRALLPSADGPWSEVKAARVLSPDGRYLTFGTTRNGEQEPTLRVYDLEEQRLLPDTIEWPLWADSDGFRPRWLSDSSGFLYVRRPDAGAQMDNTERARNGQVFIHRLGTPRAEDAALFGYGLTPGILETDTLYVQGEPHPRWLAILRRMATGREIWVLDLATIGKSPLPQARRIFASDVLARGYGVLGDHLYTVDSADAPRFELVRFDLRSPAPVREVALPQQEGVIGSMALASDAVYVAESVLNESRLHVVDDDGHRSLALGGGTVAALTAGPEGEGAWIEQVDWTQPRSGRVLGVGAKHPAAPPVMGDYPRPEARFSSRVEWATARDGERIPYTIVQRQGATPDGNAYVMLDGYGCFGTSNTAFYWPALEAWLERGGVFVRAAIRGGGELGADWHRAGRDRNKPAAFEDAIDVAKHLVRTGVTRPGRIGVTGGSCGGMTMGMAAIEAPHLIGAAVLSAGAFDQWRMAGQTAAGARSIRDVGDPATAEGTRRILALSPYMQLLDGAERPALLIASGATDYTIPLWVGGKMVARARASQPDGKPVLWDIKWKAGHSAGVDYTQLDTDNFAFLFWQLGHPDFQPRTEDPAPAGE